jgi:hypothetical protein
MGTSGGFCAIAKSFLKASLNGDSMDYIVVAGWYGSVKKVYGEVENILKKWYSYIHRVLAQNDPIFTKYWRAMILNGNMWWI